MQSFELASARLDGEWRGAPGLTVLYDEGCDMCRRLRKWLGSRSTLVPVEFVPAGSPLAGARFPDLDHGRTTTVLTVVDTTGAVYEAERAWLACAWALPGWQPTAELFGSRSGLLLVKAFTSAVDRHHRRRTLASPPAVTAPYPSAIVVSPSAAGRGRRRKMIFFYGSGCDSCWTGPSAPPSSR